MKGRIAALALAIVLLAAPTLGAAETMGACPPCCPQLAEAPCEMGEAPCASLAAAPCCDVAPAAPASQARRSVEAPNLHPAAAALRASVPAPPRLASHRAAGDLALRTSTLRFSVVLLI
jgi:hypothetical protein